ncbi:fimbrial protein [Citrobacter amalonaticus]|uniref:fimbrial protein n=1 Tax=Citrobacter amalonaticus TaxID=35703 RepID=UPI00300D755D
MKRRNKTIVLPFMMMMCSGKLVCAQSIEQGRVSMQGSIIDTPCAIVTDDLEQTIDLGIATMGDIVQNGEGAEHTFSLHFVNCDSGADSASGAGLHEFQTTFDGPAQGDIFNLSGASGIGLQISDAAGNIAFPGKPMPSIPLTTDNQRVDYTLRLMGNNHRLKAGNFHSVLRFKVDYF